ncbi:Serine/threonine-protein phosphatase 2A regulatory subunit B'' subunit gamma [Dermatophagoides farinae]|uniref:Serine/threonine-protein phosphatase 2A regulatory subunit B'' subunit gamma n=1 Tax=Dermatophagoides farinae TaxID=6954 RepID=A0A922HR59_DERFA|nr:Serine/threonine-protein phosphatase 2A regulatory subunit B'' subunit gamma [Dermatophagoides farinae]
MDPFHFTEIPEFYHNRNGNDNVICAKLREQASATIFTQLLSEHQSLSSSSLSSIQSTGGKISILTFFRYVMRKIWLQQARVSLSFWDSSANGYLTRLDLENYIRQLIPTLTKLNNMDKSYYPFYICVATRKFFFILDPHKHNRIRIIDVLFSGLLDDLLELRNNGDGYDHNDSNNHQPHHHQQQQQQTTNTGNRNQSIIDNFNWFSAANTIRLYNMYIDLDDDHNGMISKLELRKFGNFNELFVEQLFDVCMTYNKEIDFKTFIDIILALENRKEIQSQHFFFTILDINHCHYLDDYVLRYFFKAIENQMRRQGQEPIRFDDFSNEIYDMIRPQKHSRRIYFDDLVASGHADTIISILIDFNGFYAYENRDSNIRLRNANNRPMSPMLNS